jgi:autotransporter-associated beta strand protein
VISGAGGKLIKTGSGMLTLSGANTFTGGIDLMQGGISLGSNSAAGTGTIRTFGSVIDYANGVNSAAPIDINSNTTQVLVLVGSAIQSGVISETGGPRPLEKIGAGNLTLSGVNTYTGTTTITAGTLTLQGGSAIADASNLTIGASGQLTLLNSETIGGLNGSGNVNLNGNTLTSGAFNDTFHLFSGVISGTGGFVKAGSDPQYLSGDNTYTGLTQVQSGSLLLGFGGTTGSIAGNAQINGGAALFFNRSNAYAYAGNISGAGAISHAGTGTTTLSGINTYTGDTVIGNGVLAASGGTAIGDTSAVNVSTSGRFDLLSSETIGSLAGNGNTVLNGNTLTTGGNNASTTYSGVMSGAGGLTKLGTGTFTLSGANAYTGATAINAGTLTVANASALGVNSAVTVANAATLALNSNLTIGSLAGTGDTTLGVNTLTTGGNNASTTYAGVMSGAGGLTKTGVGTFFLTGENTYAGGTQVNSGSLILSNGGDVQGNVNVSGAGVFGFQKSSAYTFGGTVSGTNMAKFGSGTVTLAAANTNTFTAVHEGTLTVSGSGTFGGPNVTISMPGPFAPATLDLGGTTQSIRALAMDFDPANAVTNGTLIATDQFVIGRGAYSANLGGAASMFKSGTGTATLSGNNTFTGGTTINNGTLVLQGGAAIADLSAVVVNPSGTLQLANNETVGNLSGFGSVNLGANVLTLGGNNANASMGGTITGAGGKLIKNGSGILALSGNNTFTGGIDIFGGGISLQTNTAAGTGPITTFGSIIDYANGIDVATPIVLSSNDTQLQQIGGAATQSGPISEIGGSRPLEKIGGGNVTLSGANTFTGPMTITDGTLTVTGGSALSDTSPTILAASGTLAVTGSETIGALSGSGALNLGSGATLTTGVNNTSTIFTGASSGAGNLTKDGTGTFLLTGANSFSGLLNVAGGALTVTPSGSLANMSVNVANGASARLGAGTLGVNGGGMTGAGMGALSVASGGTLYLDDNTTVGASSLTLSTGSNLGVFLTTDTSIYPQIALTGAANVGGNLDVYLDPLSFGSTTATTFTYDNVILGATRTGTFGAVNLLQTPNNLFSAAALYGANDVDLQVTRSSFASLGGPGGNAGSVGGAIETIFVGGTTQPDLLNLINTVASASPAQILIIYSNISGSINAEVEAAGLRTDDPWKQTVAERVNAARAPGCTVAGDTWCLRRYAQAAAPVMSDVQGDPSAFDWLQTGIREDGTTSAWLRAVGAWAEADSSLNAPGSTQWTGGVIGGIDRVFDSLLLAGVAGQYLETNVDFDKSTNKSNVKAVQLGGYVSYGGAEAYLNANASVIGSTAKSERRMSVGLIDYDIDSFLRTWTYTFAAEAGTIIEDDGFRFEPSVALNFSHGQTGEYAESNGGGLALLVRPEDTQSLRSTLTARLSKVIDVGDRKIVPQLKIDWRHEMLDRGQGFDAAFAGAPDVWFKVDGTQYGRDTFTMGAAVTVPITGRITGYVDAQGSLNEDVVSGMASMGVRATW